jgi:hypothetical protein
MSVLVVPPTPAPHHGTVTPLTSLLRRWGIQCEFEVEHRGNDVVDLLLDIAIYFREFLLILRNVEHGVMEHMGNHGFLLRQYCWRIWISEAR